MQIDECEMTKGQFLAMPLCLGREAAVAVAAEKSGPVRYKLSTGEWVCLMAEGKTVLPTVPKFLRVGKNVSW